MRLDAEARELLIASYHEGGHAAAHAIESDLPLYDARIWVRRRLFGRPEGCGEVRLTRRGGAHINAVGAYILASLAGPEAEARIVHQLDGGSLNRARRDAYAYSRDGDLDMVAELIDENTPFTLDNAKGEASDLVDRILPAIESVAAALREHGRLDAREIRQATRRRVDAR